MREFLHLLWEKIESWIDRPCCRNPEIVKRSFEGTEKDFCLACGLYQRTPLKKN